MEIDPTTSGANAIGGNGVSAPETELDRDAFMRLLVTQIKNQDPMDPMDTRDMMAQLTQLTSVEHLIGIEEGLGALQVGTASIANAQVASFVGKEVTADASTLRLDEAGSAQGAFELEGHAEQVTVTIRDAEGRVVRTMDLGEHYAGPQGYEWDGVGDDGERLPPGRYRVEVEATAAGGAPVTAHTRIRGTVTGVSYEDGYPELLIGGHRVLMGDVREVSGGSGQAAASSSTSSGAPVSNPLTEEDERQAARPSAAHSTALGAATQPLPTNPEAIVASYNSRQ